MTRPPSSNSNTVATLNDLSENDLAEARGLAARTRAKAVEHLCKLVVDCDLGDAARFVDEVLVGSEDPRTWGRKDVLVLPLHSAEQLSQPLSMVLAPIQEVDRRYWMRRTPTAATWRSPFAGAPGILSLSRPYWLPPPVGFTTIVASQRDDIDPFQDLEIAGRRWLASRIASRLHALALPATAEEVRTALGVTGSLSRDAEIALAALRREASLGGASTGMPGFRGPDEWFAG